MDKFLEFLRDPNDQLSLKRLVGASAWLNGIAFIWIFVALGKLSADTGLNAFLMVTGAGLFAATIDHWAPGKA